MTQFIRPVATDFDPGWNYSGTTPAHTNIDEVVLNTFDYIWESGSTDQIRFSLTSLANPPSNGIATVRINGRTESTANSLQWEVRQGQFGTILASGEYNPGNSSNTFTDTFNVSNVTDWSDIKLLMKPKFNNSTWVLCNWFEIEVPDAPPQFLRPDSDITTGSWASTPLWSKLDEVVPDDSDSINGIGTTAVLGISSGVGVSSGSATFRVRMAEGSDSGLTAELKKNNTTISTLTATSNQLATYTHTFNAVNLGDTSGLTVELVAARPSGFFPTVATVSWIEIELPGVPVTRRVKVHNGSSWEAKPLKVHSGSWEEKPVKFHDGSSWT